jgi:hypothetical protein
MASFRDDLYIIYNTRAPSSDGPPPGTPSGPMSLPISYRKTRLPLREVDFAYFRDVLMALYDEEYKGRDYSKES